MWLEISDIAVSYIQLRDINFQGRDYDVTTALYAEWMMWMISKADHWQESYLIIYNYRRSLCTLV